MTSNFEIPDTMRDFAARSVDQARKAFDEFMDAAQKAAGDVDQSSSAMQESARSIQEETMSFAEASVAASFDLAQKLVRARDVTEMVHIQQDFLRQQMQAFAEQSERLARVAATGADKVGKPRKRRG